MASKPMKTNPALRIKECTNCGTFNDPVYKRCLHCGEDIEKEKATIPVEIQIEFTAQRAFEMMQQQGGGGHQVNLTADEIVRALQKGGFTANLTDATIDQIAAKVQKSGIDLSADALEEIKAEILQGSNRTAEQLSEMFRMEAEERGKASERSSKGITSVLWLIAVILVVIAAGVFLTQCNDNNPVVNTENATATAKPDEKKTEVKGGEKPTPTPAPQPQPTPAPTPAPAPAAVPDKAACLAYCVQEQVAIGIEADVANNACAATCGN